MRSVQIKFIEPKTPYMKGEVAVFPESQAEILVSKGYAIYADTGRDRDAAALKHLASAPQTRHIPGPQQTKAQDGPKCGICRKPGHNRANCPESK